MALKILSLEVKDPRVNFIKKYTFDQELLVNQSEAAFILHNLLNFVTIPYRNSMEAITEIDVNGEVVKIEKLYQSGEVKYYINNQLENVDIYHWIESKLKINFEPKTWESRFIDFRDKNIESSEDLINLFKERDAELRLNPSVTQEYESLSSQLKTLKSESLKGLTADQIKKVERLSDIKIRINKIQKEVDSYQSQRDSKESLNKKIADLELKFNTTRDKLDSVSTLITSRSNILKELKKYDSTWAENISELKERKNLKTNEYLQTAYTKPENKTVVEEDRDTHLKFNKIFLIVQIPLTLLLTFVAYFLLQLDLILILGFVVILLEFAFIIYETFKKDEEDLSLLVKQELPQQDVNLIENNLDNDKLFIDQAWRGAYQNEVSKIDQLILSNLEGREVAQVEQEKSIIEQELNSLKKELSTLESNELDSEAYYKKRRELDILKIEKENIEFDGSIQIPNEARIEELTNKVGELEDSIDSVEELKSKIPFIMINVKESVKELINNIADLRQIILINSSK